MKAYKLTNQDMTTHGDCKWVVGEWTETNGEGEMCGPGWLHCYDDPLLAVLHNPIHANIKDPMLWEVEVEGEKKTDGLKSAYTRMRLVKRVAMPRISRVKKIAYAILCAKEVCKDKEWNAWADDWLSGKGRSKKAAWAAAAAAAVAAAAAAGGAGWAAEVVSVGVEAAAAAGAVSGSVVRKSVDFVAIAHKAILIK